MDWKDCIYRSISKEVKLDKNLVISLLNSADKKLEAEAHLPSTLPEPKICLIYDALRSILEALALQRGFKIYNHECYTPFLKEILNESALGDKFDEFRKLRNAINYYGKDVSENEAKFIIKEMKEWIKIIQKELTP